MAERIACSCVTCPKCGIWVVIRPQNQLALSPKKSLARCPAAECGKEFEFEASETRIFEVPLPLFERRHFYGSELQESEDDRVFLAGYVDRFSHLILAISRQNALRMAPAETPNS